MKISRILSSQRGDTIVEVMIATAILGAVLGGAYSISSRALRAGRIAQERVEALKLAEGQLERLKYEAKANGGFDSLYRVNNYCLSADDSSGNTRQNPNPDPTTGNYNDECAPGDLYKINITYVATVPAPKYFGAFAVSVNWERLGGGQDEVIINYLL